MASNNKSQAAMEFLLSYGWAIIVVLVVIGALAYFGVLQPAKMLPDKCNFQVGLSCIDYSATNKGYPVEDTYIQTQADTIKSVNFDAVNNLGEDVYVTKIAVSGKDVNCVNVQFDECTGDDAQYSFVTALLGGAFDPTKTCLSVKEACSLQIGGEDICDPSTTAKNLILWKNGNNLKTVLGAYRSNYLSLLCSNLPETGQRLDGTISIEYTKTDPALPGALKHTAYGGIHVTVT